MKLRSFLAALIGLALAAPAFAQSAQDIAAKASAAAYYAGSTGRADVSMVITDRQGRERKRQLTILRRNDGGANGDQKFYVYFHRPADVSRTSFLVWKKARGADDRWLYLPALDQVRRIAASDERTSFVGSHFFYEDLSGRHPSEDRHELIDTTADYYVLRSTPRGGRVEFAHFVSYIEKRSFIPVRVDFFDKQGERYRVYEALKVSNVDGIPTVIEARMSDSRIGGSTAVSYRKVRYNVDLPEQVFTERALRAAPTEFLR